jgi:hypothetical protein
MKMDALRWHHAIGRHVDPTSDLLCLENLRAERVLQCNRHRAGRLARADDRDSSHMTQIDYIVTNCQPIAVHAHVLGHEPFRPYSVDTSPPDTFGISSKFGGNGRHKSPAIAEQTP